MKDEQENEKSRASVEDLKDLVVAAQSGDLEAFGRMVRRFQDMAYGYAYAILGDFHLAQDAAQEAFLTAYRELSQLRQAEAFAGWLRRIVFTECSRMTRRRRIPTVPLEAAAEAPSDQDPARAVEQHQVEQKVLAAIAALPESQRQVTTLFYINGYSQAEIAGFLEQPITTIKKRLHDARRRLRQRMIQMVDETLKGHALPGGFADLVVRKAATDDDLRRAAELIPWHSKHNPEHFRSVREADQAGVFVVGENGSVEGAGYFTESELGIGSTILRVVRPAEIGGESRGVPDPAFVRSVQACFRLARERGIHLAIAHGSQFDHAFCGFVPCFYYPVATLPSDQAANVTSRATLAEADAEQTELAHRAWLTDPYTPKMSAFIGGGTPRVVLEEGNVTGYARVNTGFQAGDHYGMGFGHVTDVTVETREAALAVIRIAGELAEAAGEPEVCLMQSHMTLITKTVLSLGGRYLLRPSCDLVGLDAEMAAIVDLAALSKELEAEFQARLDASGARGITAAFSLGMGVEVVGFAAASGRLKVTARRQKVHRMLPRWLLTRLCLGYHSGEDLLAMGPLPWDRKDGLNPDEPALDMMPLSLSGNEAILFRALFPKMWPVSWPDPDVWPWVIGEEHPRYQNADRKTPEMKAQIDALRFPWIGH